MSLLTFCEADAGNITTCPLGEVLIYKNLIYILNFQICCILNHEIS